MEAEHTNFGNRPDKCFVYFVGNAVNFSVSILRAAQNEFSEVTFRRAASLAALNELPIDESSNILAIIVDESLFGDFMHTMSELRSVHPNTVLAVAYRSPDAVRAQLTEQMCGTSLYNVSFLPMNIHFDSWLSILHLILGGDGYVSREVLMPPPEPSSDQTLNTYAPPSKSEEATVKGNLTKREIEVLSNVAAGKQNKLIAHELDLSEHTIKLHIHHVIAKLGVCNRTEAAAWFFQHRHLLDKSFRK
ncbi:response regulator transcription factor [uncultured Tateyamaria sp.]|uniref:response regulator transcription factor n=1 Tax=uncultured Tateyamaria sp. TaxID=455651 RepID=UPI00262DED5B|nr:response regulator transcription factor [uncultured Tateyamaria sp.]